MGSEIALHIDDEEINSKTSFQGLWGIIFALVVLVGNGVHPIINSSRPEDLSALQFVFLMSLIECCLSLPFFIKDMKKRKLTPITSDLTSFQKLPIKNVISRLVLVGLIFSLATYLYIEGLTLAGGVSGSIALKTSPIYAMIVGFFFLHEKFDIKQIFLTFLMLVGLFYLGTEGKFELDAFSLGFGMCLITPLFWTIGHAITKPLLVNKRAPPSQVIFIRSGVITLTIFCVNVFNDGLQIILHSFTQINHLFFAFLMGGTYFLMHLSWYNSISLIDLSYASALVTPSPVITALLSFIILGEPIKGYHIIGMAIMLIGLYLMIYIKAKKRNKEKKN
ncbi:DMT family transporter [Candidatus Lokiarchaeum ossiferum]|uniref:DMT family transporter n=1 Tax=Candidatus Lokiarchaeum ossiferum TaxID=2951803 RepID=UPI00352DF9F9